ncbi:hypothetical protein F4802DRAFT_393316 [Xylaria palmicola]|nr:hypothetical protein F4802DRAFT_393316 [Xylaria palmicola]
MENDYQDNNIRHPVRIDRLDVNLHFIDHGLIRNLIIVSFLTLLRKHSNRVNVMESVKITTPETISWVRSNLSSCGQFQDIAHSEFIPARLVQVDCGPPRLVEMNGPDTRVLGCNSILQHERSTLALYILINLTGGDVPFY